MKSLREIVEFEKARSILFGQWGFGVSEEQVHTHMNMYNIHTLTCIHAYTMYMYMQIHMNMYTMYIHCKIYSAPP